MILIHKMPNGESRENELGDGQQEKETNMVDLSGGEQLGSRDTVRSRTPHPATMTTCVPHSGGSMAFRWLRVEFNGEPSLASSSSATLLANTHCIYSLALYYIKLKSICGCSTWVIIYLTYFLFHSCSKK